MVAGSSLGLHGQTAFFQKWKKQSGYVRLASSAEEEMCWPHYTSLHDDVLLVCIN